MNQRLDEQPVDAAAPAEGRVRADLVALWPALAALAAVAVAAAGALGAIRGPAAAVAVGSACLAAVTVPTGLQRVLGPTALIGAVALALNGTTPGLAALVVALAVATALAGGRSRLDWTTVATLVGSGTFFVALRATPASDLGAGVSDHSSWVALAGLVVCVAALERASQSPAACALAAAAAVGAVAAGAEGPIVIGAAVAIGLGFASARRPASALAAAAVAGAAIPGAAVGANAAGALALIAALAVAVVPRPRSALAAMGVSLLLTPAGAVGLGALVAREPTSMAFLVILAAAVLSILALPRATDPGSSAASPAAGRSTGPPTPLRPQASTITEPSIGDPPLGAAAGSSVSEPVPVVGLVGLVPALFALVVPGSLAKALTPTADGALGGWWVGASLTIGGVVIALLLGSVIEPLTTLRGPGPARGAGRRKLRRGERGFTEATAALKDENTRADTVSTPTISTRPTVATPDEAGADPFGDQAGPDWADAPLWTDDGWSDGDDPDDAGHPES